MRPYKYLLPLLLLLLTSCAHRKLSREEWLSVTQRTFSGIPQETLISKAEEVLILADGDDFNFAHNKNGFSASRNWAAYFVIGAAVGTDFWTFEVEPQGKDKIVARISVSAVAGNVVPGGSGSTITTPGQSSAVQGNAVYNVFWSRLDYLLGKTTQWMDCRLVSKKMSTGELFGNDEPICNSFNLRNALPENLSDSEVDRIFGSPGPGDPGLKKKDYIKKRDESKGK